MSDHSETWLFAGLCVRDRAAALPRYEAFFGAPPTMLPNEREAVWQVAEFRSVYIVERPDRVGAGLVTLFSARLDTHLAEVAARGLTPLRVEDYGNGVRKAVFNDPDGNEIDLGGMPEAAE